MPVCLWQIEYKVLEKNTIPSIIGLILAHFKLNIDLILSVPLTTLNAEKVDGVTKM